MKQITESHPSCCDTVMLKSRVCFHLQIWGFNKSALSGDSSPWVLLYQLPLGSASGSSYNSEQRS